MVFIKNNWERISGAVNLLCGVISLVLSAVSVFSSQLDLSWAIVLALIALWALYYIIMTVTFGFFISKNRLAIEQAEKRAHHFEERFQNCNKIVTKLCYFVNHIIGTLDHFINASARLHNTYAEEINAANRSREDLSGADSNQLDSHIQLRKKTATAAYEEGLRKNYSHFMANIIGKLQETLNYYLASKGLQLTVSIAVKHFSSVLEDPSKSHNVKVLTTFRDNMTYTLRKREIGERDYSIEKNTAFQHCLHESYFLRNNINPDDRSYLNEHKDFLQCYNCVVVSKIYTRDDVGNRVFGYLACDVNNANEKVTDVFDSHAANLVEVTAQIIGQFLDTLDAHWENSLGKDFAEETYYRHKKS